MRWLFHWRKQYFGLWTGILKRSNGLKLKTLISFLQTCSVFLHKMLIDGLESCGLLVIFLSAVCTLILTAPIHSRGSTCEQGMECFLQIWWRNKLIYIWMTWGWVNYQQVFIFGWTISLKIIGVDVSTLTFIISMCETSGLFHFQLF